MVFMGIILGMKFNIEDKHFTALSPGTFFVGARVNDDPDLIRWRLEFRH